MDRQQGSQSVSQGDKKLSFKAQKETRNEGFPPPQKPQQTTAWYSLHKPQVDLFPYRLID